MAYQLNINWPEFLEKYWQKQPVVLKRVSGLRRPDYSGRAGRISHGAGSRQPAGQPENGKWQASNGPFEHFDGLGETGWSLLARAVNHWHMPAAELVRPFRVLPDWRSTT